MGLDRVPLWIKIDKKFHKKVPAEVSLVYNRRSKHYEFHATYATQPKQSKTKVGSAVAVDMGEIHPIVTFDGIHSEIYNGREPRSKVRYREKSKAKINRKLSRCKRGSRRWKKLKRAKNRTLAALAAQLRDMRHKITSRFVSTCHERKIETIVIGDIKHIRQSINWQGHRDVVGASNILTAYQGFLFNPVVGAVVSPTGVRFNPYLRRLDKWSPFSVLKSSKPSKRR